MSASLRRALSQRCTPYYIVVVVGKACTSAERREEREGAVSFSHASSVTRKVGCDPPLNDAFCEARRIVELHVCILRDSLARAGLIACAWLARVLHAVGIARERVLVAPVPHNAAVARHRLESRDTDRRSPLRLGPVITRRVENNVRIFPVVPSDSHTHTNEHDYVPVEFGLRDADAATATAAGAL